MKIEFSRQFFENTQIWNLMKIRAVGDELFHGGRRTDMAKLILVLRSFANAPENITHVPKRSMNRSDTPEFTIHPITTAHIHRTCGWSTMKPNISLHCTSFLWFPLDQVRLHGRFQRTDMQYSTHPGWCQFGPILGLIPPLRHAEHCFRSMCWGNGTDLDERKSCMTWSALC
jgi:hypothetical protein